MGYLDTVWARVNTWGVPVALAGLLVCLFAPKLGGLINTDEKTRARWVTILRVCGLALCAAGALNALDFI